MRSRADHGAELPCGEARTAAPPGVPVTVLAQRLTALRVIGAILLGAMLSGASAAVVVTRYLDRIARLEETARWQTRALWHIAQTLQVPLADPPP